MRKLLVLLAAALSLASPALAEGRASIASGEAATREAALSSALRHAVEQVVGLSINTGTYVQNLKQIQDRVFTQAAGYIETYDVVAEERLPGGGYRVTVNATVSQQKLGQAMTPIVGNAMAFEGSVALANLKLRQDDEAAIRKALQEQVVDLGLNGIKFSYDLSTEASGDGSTVYLRLDNFVAEVDQAWYSSFKKLHTQLTATDIGKKTTASYGDKADQEIGGRSIVMTLLAADGEVVGTVLGESWGTASDRSVDLLKALVADLTKSPTLPYLPPSRNLRAPLGFSVPKKLLAVTSKFTLAIPVQ